MNISVVCFSSSIMRLFTMKGTPSKYQQKKLIIRMATERKTFACPSMHAKCANEPWNSFSKIMEQCAILQSFWNGLGIRYQTNFIHFLPETCFIFVPNFVFTTFHEINGRQLYYFEVELKHTRIHMDLGWIRAIVIFRSQ